MTDVGTLDDKNFNEYSGKGTQDGGAKIGGRGQGRRHRGSADIAKNVQAFVDQRYQIIVTAASPWRTTPSRPRRPTRASSSSASTRRSADQKPGPDRRSPARVTRARSAQLPGHRLQGAAPATWPASSRRQLSASGKIAAVGGTKAIPAVTNYISGYENGAKSVNPDIKVVVQYVSPRLPDKAAFNDADAWQGIRYEQLIEQDADVIFQVAGATGNGVLEAACDADRNGIGVDVDQCCPGRPNPNTCIVTARRRSSKKTVGAQRSIAGGPQERRTPVRRRQRGMSAYRRSTTTPDLLTPEMQALIDEAIALEGGRAQACQEAAQARAACCCTP